MFDFYDDDEYETSDICPQCSIGRIRMIARPYLQLYRGHLFTIPDATYYGCDACDYHEWDDSIIDVIGDMLFGARQSPEDVKNRHFSHTLNTEDDPQNPSEYRPSS